MHGYDAVMQPNGEFFGLIGFVFQPAARLVIEMPQLESNRVRRRSDVGVVLTVLPGPLPNLIKHRCMQSLQEGIREHAGQAHAAGA